MIPLSDDDSALDVWYIILILKPETDSFLFSGFNPDYHQARSRNSTYFKVDLYDHHAITAWFFSFFSGSYEISLQLGVWKDTFKFFALNDRFDYILYLCRMYLINSFFVIWSKWRKTKKSAVLFVYFFFNWEFFSLLTNKKFTFSVKSKQTGQLIFSFLVTLTK